METVKQELDICFNRSDNEDIKKETLVVCFKRVRFLDLRDEIVAIDINSKDGNCYKGFRLFEGWEPVPVEFIRGRMINAKPNEIVATKTNLERLGYTVNTVNSLRG